MHNHFLSPAMKCAHTPPAPAASLSLSLSLSGSEGAKARQPCTSRSTSRSSSTTCGEAVVRCWLVLVVCALSSSYAALEILSEDEWKTESSITKTMTMSSTADTVSDGNGNDKADVFLSHSHSVPVLDWGLLPLEVVSRHTVSSYVLSLNVSTPLLIRRSPIVVWRAMSTWNSKYFLSKSSLISKPLHVKVSTKNEFRYANMQNHMAQSPHLQGKNLTGPVWTRKMNMKQFINAIDRHSEISHQANSKVNDKDNSKVSGASTDQQQQHAVSVHAQAALYRQHEHEQQSLDESQPERLFHYFSDGISVLGPAFYSDFSPYEFLSPTNSSSDVDCLIWFGQRGVSAWTHFDTDHNFYAQINGRKRFQLIQFAATKLLKLYPAAHPFFRQTFIDAHHQNVNAQLSQLAKTQADTDSDLQVANEEHRHPQAHSTTSSFASHEPSSLSSTRIATPWTASASPSSDSASACASASTIVPFAFDVILDSGDLLYLPPYWLHRVTSLTSSYSLSCWHPSKLFTHFDSAFTIPLPLEDFWSTAMKKYAAFQLITFLAYFFAQHSPAGTLQCAQLASPSDPSPSPSPSHSHSQVSQSLSASRADASARSAATGSQCEDSDSQPHNLLWQLFDERYAHADAFSHLDFSRHCTGHWSELCGVRNETETLHYFQVHSQDEEEVSEQKFELQWRARHFLTNRLINISTQIVDDIFLSCTVRADLSVRRAHLFNFIEELSMWATTLEEQPFFLGCCWNYRLFQ